MAAPFQHPFQQSQFDLFDWYPKFQSCRRHFLEHAQHQSAIQAIAAHINIRLPHQKLLRDDCRSASKATTSASTSSLAAQASTEDSTIEFGTSDHPPGYNQALDALLPYVRRLVVTGCDTTPVMHGFFGDNWQQGIGPIHEKERRNYLLAAKSDTWLRVKQQYDMEEGQTVPFLKPLQNVSIEEIRAAEASWSEWLAMQDWMLGPRAPPAASED